MREQLSFYVTGLLAMGAATLLARALEWSDQGVFGAGILALAVVVAIFISRDDTPRQPSRAKPPR